MPCHGIAFRYCVAVNVNVCLSKSIIEFKPVTADAEAKRQLKVALVSVQQQQKS